VQMCFSVAEWILYSALDLAGSPCNICWSGVPVYASKSLQIHKSPYLQVS